MHEVKALVQVITPRLRSLRALLLDDGYQDLSSWSLLGRGGVKLSSSIEEWDNFRNTFGEVSIFNALSQSKTSAAAEELHFTVRNNTDSTIGKAIPVCVTGAIGQHPTIGLADNTDDSTFIVLGLTAASIAKNTQGIVVTEGMLRGLNTNGYNEGDILYVGAAPGQLTNVLPPGTSYYAAIGQVLLKSPTNGAIGVHPRRIARQAGTTAKRPIARRTGDMYLDTTLGFPVWWNGANWVNSAGTTV